MGRKNSGTSTAPILSGSGCALRGWAERPSTQARRFGEPQKLSSFILGALFVLSLSPPRGVAANCAAQRVARARQRFSPNHDQRFSPILSVSGCALRGWAERPSAQARRFYEPQKHGQQLGPARRENRSRFSRLKNKHSPKHSPVLRPVSASLRLRYRSAAFSRACAIHSISAVNRNS